MSVREELVSEPHVADALITLAEATGADVIVDGTHGLTPLIDMRLDGAHCASCTRPRFR